MDSYYIDQQLRLDQQARLGQQVSLMQQARLDSLMQQARLNQQDSLMQPVRLNQQAAGLITGLPSGGCWLGGEKVRPDPPLAEVGYSINEMEMEVKKHLEDWDK